MQRYSQLFGKTSKTVPKDAPAASHQLLLQAGFIQESSAGRYFFLPLGMRVNDKIVSLIEKEMNAAGYQKMISPVLHPLELWQETNRTATTGFELMTIKDRRGASFALGGTAEEMFVDVVRRYTISYKDLPLKLYQFSQKFRDELRARGGLLRVREFLMKDGYSFHTDAEEFKEEYTKMGAVYEAIFKNLGLNAKSVLSDNGYIGGEYCHEFIVDSDVGESRYLESEDGAYCAHEDVAVFLRDQKNTSEPELPLQEVSAERGTTMEDGVLFHNLPLWQQIKDVVFVDEKGRYILALIRGDFDVNEIKLMHHTGSIHLRPATDEEIRTQLNSESGFISPVGIQERKDVACELIRVADLSLRTIKNAYGGANQKYRDLRNINIDRDYTVDIECDIALAKEGYTSEHGIPLIEKKGIEVGNIFQLGYHYSSKMRGAEFTDTDGKRKPYYMGCYGIGVGRTLATIVEKFHDERGIIWPRSVAPYDIHLITLKEISDETVLPLIARLEEAGFSVLWDDRPDVRAGEKFADADLIGIPVRLVLSEKSLAQGGIEWKQRNQQDSQIVSTGQIIEFMKSL